MGKLMQNGKVCYKPHFPAIKTSLFNSFFQFELFLPCKNAGTASLGTEVSSIAGLAVDLALPLAQDAAVHSLVANLENRGQLKGKSHGLALIKA